MQLGDFTNLAKQYINRPAYNDHLLKTLLLYTGYLQKPNFSVADVGAGTGKLTKMLLEKGLSVTAVEPNDSMRAEGTIYTDAFNVSWQAGSGEHTNLSTESYDWAVMASSFHWTDSGKSLPEFSRILKPGGYFTAIWNPRNIEVSELHSRIENNIYDIAPSISRVSSGSKTNTKKWEEILISTGHFSNVIFMEVDHIEVMSKERYLGAWNSVNDIQAQAGPDNWSKILAMIEKEIAHLDMIEVPYKNRAWTAQRVG
jgi:ubiquinone/menaquinone biosynthesis C-methylase UbiE